MVRHLIRLGGEEGGEAAISYSLIAALISIAAIIAMTQLGDTLPHLFDLVSNALKEGLSRVGLI